MEILNDSDMYYTSTALMQLNIKRIAPGATVIVPDEVGAALIERNPTRFKIVKSAKNKMVKNRRQIKRK